MIFPPCAKVKPALTAFAISLCGLFLLAAAPSLRALENAAPTPKRSLTLSANGSVDSRPDMVSISAGIVTEAVKARNALDDNNEVMAQMLKTLKARGIAEDDIATTQFSVQPRYQSYKTGRSSKIVGYRVVNSVQIVVRDLDQLGATLDRLVTIGSNRINAIRFGLSEPDKAADEARLSAMSKALHKANLYAKAAGVRLGPIISISENMRHIQPRPVRVRTLSSRSKAVPIAPGKQKTTLTVHVKWALVQ